MKSVHNTLLFLAVTLNAWTCDTTSVKPHYLISSSRYLPSLFPFQIRLYIVNPTSTCLTSPPTQNHNLPQKDTISTSDRREGNSKKFLNQSICLQRKHPQERHRPSLGLCSTRMPATLRNNASIRTRLLSQHIIKPHFFIP
jgi:hypothetical protein